MHFLNQASRLDRSVFIRVQPTVNVLTMNARVKVLSTCSIMLGMHPDQATEPILQCALRFHKPLSIVPCCVFQLENSSRRFHLPGGDLSEVVTYEHLVEYIAQTGRTQRCRLPFEGRNVILYVLPAPAAVDVESNIFLPGSTIASCPGTSELYPSDLRCVKV